MLDQLPATQQETSWRRRYALDVVRGMKARQQEGPRYNWYGERYCVHGTNVGTDYGPDILCGWCEDGASIYDFALSRAAYAWANQQAECERALCAAFSAGIASGSVSGLYLLSLLDADLRRTHDPLNAPPF